MSGPMIRVTGDDCQCPIKLFGHEGPHDLMRHGQGTEGDDQLGALEDLGIEPVRAADDAGKTSHAVVPPLPDTPGERVARGALAPLVEDDEGRIPARSDMAAASSARRSSSRRARLSGNSTMSSPVNPRLRPRPSMRCR